MSKDKILKQKVYHNGTSMVVLNAGDRHTVPEDRRQSFIDEGIIAGKTSDELAREAAEHAAAEQDGDDASLFTAKHIAGGLYEITGPGLEQPERVKGKTETEVRIAELVEAHKAAAASAADGAGAPPV
ncbi:hypothetical protein SAMIE_1015460 [Sphingobium amiense]|uniref:Uncharacterized protein n=1 Tax=Sphingobium amiense TaxID=135719 RepID=A0A494WC01_9SPHN|nr:hypothetical protein [Sphingobium amiense]BBD98045.1 hypothetical protein SAMIE_1015460 [Sphingobium amiense]